MLDELRVRNAGVISDATIEPAPGFVVVTGETGTGKTLLLGALRLLLGEPARKDQIGPAADELVVEGRFAVDEDEHVVRRRVQTNGRSRAYLDGEMVAARVLVDTVAPLVELVAQHDALRLSASAGVLRLIDGAMDSEGAALLDEYRARFARLSELRERQELLGGDRRAIERELDMARFQADEIEEAGFSAGDDRALAEAASRLRNAEIIAEHLATLQLALAGEDGGAASMSTATGAVARLAALDPIFRSLEEQVREAALLVDDLAAEVGRTATDFDRDPAALDVTEQRLALLGSLQRKYGESLDEVLRFGGEARSRAAELTKLLDDASTLEADVEKATMAIDDAGVRLTASRRSAAAELTERAVAHLCDLGFSAPTVSIELTATTPGPGGADRASIVFASDTSLTPSAISRVASGGELSRLVLALRLAAGVAEAPVVAFDEIDAGIGGETALAMGRKLRDLATGRQVLAVTHLPQVAAFAACHFVVRRNGPAASVVRVDGEDRLEELSRMLAGLSESAKGREHAAELLEMAQT